MTVKKLSKKIPEVKKITRVDEQRIEQFIGGGGKTTEEARSNPDMLEENLTRFTLRMPKAIVKMIDDHRKAKVGNVSRNTWILKAIAKSLKLDD